MTGTPTGMSLSLPRAGALTDALVAEPDEAPPLAELRDVRDRLTSELAALAGELPAGEKLRIDGYRFTMARDRPERCGEVDGPFVPSPAVCRRTLGLGAVARCARRRSASPATAVAEVLAAGAEEAGDADDPTVRAPWWAGWYGGLGDGARAMVEADAVTWATQLWTAVEWERLAPGSTVGGADDWWDCPGTRALTLRGRADVRVRSGARPSLLVIGSGLPPADWGVTLGFPALVAGLARGERGLPVRVVGLWPASGQVRILPVDGPALAATATAVVGAAATWVDARIERQGAAGR